MVNLMTLFYIFLGIFGLVGLMRGWTKELLVGVSVFVSLAFINAFENFLPFFRDLYQEGSITEFWVRTAFLIFLVFFGYQSPRIPRFAMAAERGEKIQSHLLGFFIGIINGFLIVGSLWAFMDNAGYPFTPFVTAPTAEVAFMNWFAPNMFLGQFPWVYVFVVVAFIILIGIL
jgi:uncharacterized membrane protein required for colicin V production